MERELEEKIKKDKELMPYYNQTPYATNFEPINEETNAY